MSENPQPEPVLSRWQRRRRQIWAILLTLLNPGLGEVYLGAWKSGAILLVAQLLLIPMIYPARWTDTAQAYLALAALLIVVVVGLRVWCLFRLAPMLSGALNVSGKRWFRTTWFTLIWLVVLQQALFSGISKPGRSFSIPSTSMIPTLQPGDYLVSSRVDLTGPLAGDVIFFPLPRDPKTDYVKRVIGFPGDRVQVRHGKLYINGAEAPRTAVGDYSFDDGASQRLGKRFIETLPNGSAHEILKLSDAPLMVAPGVDLNNTVEYLVPPGMVFVLGDNRDNSLDSRMMKEVGFVPISSIKGRDGIIFYSRERARIFSTIH